MPARIKVQVGDQNPAKTLTVVKRYAGQMYGVSQTILECECNRCKKVHIYNAKRFNRNNHGCTECHKSVYFSRNQRPHYRKNQKMPVWGRGLVR